MVLELSSSVDEAHDDLWTEVELTRVAESTPRVATSEDDHFKSLCQDFIGDFDPNMAFFLYFVGDDAASSA